MVLRPGVSGPKCQSVLPPIRQVISLQPVTLPAAAINPDYSYSCRPEQATGSTAGTSVASGEWHLHQAGSSCEHRLRRSGNREVFEQWYEWICNYAPRSQLELVTIILAVRKGGPALPSSEWSRLIGSSVYMPLTDASEGQRIRDENRRLLVMVSTEAIGHARVSLTLTRNNTTARCTHNECVNY